MDHNLDFTMEFKAIKTDDMTVNDAILKVNEALIEKGYKSTNQIIGYILSGDSSYITSHSNARNTIKKFERDEILEEILEFYLKEKSKSN